MKSYQNIAGQSIFEIGRRLKHVKENDLVHGQWSDWLQSINMSRGQATKFIKISDEFSNDSPVNHLGIKALYSLATIPEEHREEKFETSSGEMKKPIDMTNRELENLKRQLKQRDEEKSQLESQLEQAQRSESIAHKQLEKYISIHNIYRR
ncbi:pathogenicity island protein [Staphylococcus ureilyticus]|nr:pathogenicity island protein [Staphylococcus ureilyticus]